MIDVPQQYPIVKIPETPRTTSDAQLRPNSILALHPNRELWRAQDSMPAQSRRVLAEYGLKGSATWAVPAGTSNPDTGVGVARIYPSDDTWRTVGVFQAKQTPGTKLEASVRYRPAGLTQVNIGGAPPNDQYQSAGAFAKFRVVAAWTLGAASTGDINFDLLMEGSNKGTYGGAESTAASEDWNVRRKKILDIMPAGFETDPTVGRLYSEWADVTLTLQVLGGERIIDAVVYEVPSVHTQDHNDTGEQTVHGAPLGEADDPRYPQTDRADGATYEHHRWGTTRVLQTAQRQGERLGPRILNFASNLHDGTGWDATAQTPISVTSTGGSYVDLFDQTLTDYDSTRWGWIVAGSMAQLQRLCAPVMLRGLYAVIPVRLVVDADLTLGDGTYGRVRFQSGLVEWVEAEYTSGGRADVEVYGHLETQVYGDQFRGILQCLVDVDGTTAQLDLYNATIEFGYGFEP